LDLVLTKKIGILGAGQLGKMICEAARDLKLDISLLDKSADCPAAKICTNFIKGDFTNYDDVLAFGLDKDIISIEIENVNIEALKSLEEKGKDVYPKPASLAIIKDKGLQKQFYIQHKFPSGEFKLFSSTNLLKEAVLKNELKLPLVWKARTGGYDGKGVAIIKSPNDFKTLPDLPCLMEKMIEIDKEVSVIVARNKSASSKAFPMVEMEFNPNTNLVEFLFSPSGVDLDTKSKAQKIALELAKKLDIVGILAVEFFISKNGTLLINEVAPRVHNSGHHTIEANETSQFHQFLRAILDLPLGDTQSLKAAAMINLLGHPDHNGPVIYKGLEKCLAQTGAHIHLYGKKETRPNRKMGHATLLDANLELAKERAKFVKNNLQIIS